VSDIPSQGQPNTASDGAVFPSLDRFNAFSDGVFAIAITLLVLDLTVPPANVDILSALRESWHEFVGYAISFAFIGGIWLTHAGLTKRMKRGDNVAYGMNLLLLLFVALLPFSTSLMVTHVNSPDVSAGVVFYGINVLLASLMLSLLLFYVAREPGLAVDGIAEQRIKRSRRGAGAQLRNPLRPHEEAGHPGPPTSRRRPGVSIGAWDHAPPPVRHVSLPACISILESATEIALLSLSCQPLSL